MVQPQKVNNEIEFTPGIELTPAHSHSNEMLEPATVNERNELLKPESNSKKALVKAIVLESSVAIHSIIIGFDLGNLGSEADVSTIRVLMIALAFHQFFEGIFFHRRRNYSIPLNTLLCGCMIRHFTWHGDIRDYS